MCLPGRCYSPPCFSTPHNQRLGQWPQGQMGEPPGHPGLPERAWHYPHRSLSSVWSSSPQMQWHLPQEVFFATLDKQMSRLHFPLSQSSFIPCSALQQPRVVLLICMLLVDLELFPRYDAKTVKTRHLLLAQYLAWAGAHEITAE